MFRSCNHNHYVVIAIVSWAIWNAQNSLVWNQKHSSANSIVASADQYLFQWRQAWILSTNALAQSLWEGDEAETWVRPHQNSIKVTVDAALFADRMEYAFGLVARDSTQQLVEEVTKCYTGNISADVAEAMAAKEALSWIKQRSWPRAELESKSFSNLIITCVEAL